MDQLNWLRAGFGLEKLGLLALRFPQITLLAILLATPLLLFGASKVEFSSDIREIFRTDSDDFSNLEELLRQYPEISGDILVSIESPKIFQSQALEELRLLHLELGLIENVSHVLSIFSARHPPTNGGKTKPLFPLDLESVPNFEDLKEQVRSHPLVSKKLLSNDNSLTLFVVALEELKNGVTGQKAAISEIRSVADEILSDPSFKISLTGLSVMRVEIIGSLIRDQRTFAMVGLSIGLILCWFFFRSLKYVVLAGVPAVFATLSLRGGMYFFGQEINVLTNVVPALIIVIVFSDALHLLFGIRRNLDSHLELDEAIEKAILEIGPACALTSLTTTIALLSLTLVPHPFVSKFGFTAASGTMIAYIATMTTLPALAKLLLDTKQVNSSDRTNYKITQWIPLLCQMATNSTASHPRKIAAVAVLILLFAASLHMQNGPRYRYQENLPEKNLAYLTIQNINDKLAGANTLHLLIRWPREHLLNSQKTLDLVKSTHEIVEEIPEINGITSLHSIEKWLMEGGVGSRELFQLLEEWNSPLSTRVMSTKHKSVLVSGYFTDMDASELIPILERLDKELDRLRQNYPGVKLSLTGIVPVSAKSSLEMISQLNRSLFIAIFIIIILIGLAFSSAVAGLMSILPNLLPVTVGGAFLFLFGQGLQFTSVIAFTVGFGIAVDGTIHVLNRYYLEKRNGRSIILALEQTIKNTGPVLIVSTIILVSGMGATLLSELPMVRLYGQVCIIVLISALLGDMLFLPAIVRLVENWRDKFSS